VAPERTTPEVVDRLYAWESVVRVINGERSVA
jgi:hypothetical protein